MGAYAYFASVFWALSLLVGLALSIQSAHTLPVYFPDQKTLFPIWPVIDHIKALYLFLGTALVVLLPKVLGVVLAVVRSPTTRGRIGRFLMGAALETVGSMLLAPILMLTQTRAVLDVARGKDSGWSVQGREHQRRELRELVRFHKAHVLIGVLTTLACSLASIYVLAWMAPVILGLLASIQLSALSARTPPAWLERALATPESLRPPPIVAAMEARRRDWCKDLHGAAAPERAAIAAMG
jgi:membrane glycosyltransferase